MRFHYKFCSFLGNVAGGAAQVDDNVVENNQDEEEEEEEEEDDEVVTMEAMLVLCQNFNCWSLSTIYNYY